MNQRNEFEKLFGPKKGLGAWDAIMEMGVSQDQFNSWPHVGYDDAGFEVHVPPRAECPVCKGTGKMQVGFGEETCIVCSNPPEGLAAEDAIWIYGVSPDQFNSWPFEGYDDEYGQTMRIPPRADCPVCEGKGKVETPSGEEDCKVCSA